MYKPFCVEATLSIQQGVYGRVMFVDDVRGTNHCTEPPSPAVGATFTLSNGASAQTDSNGVYQIEAAGGDYTLCFPNAAYCTPVTVPTSGRVRMDADTPITIIYMVQPPGCT